VGVTFPHPCSLFKLPPCVRKPHQDIYIIAYVFF